MAPTLFPTTVRVMLAVGALLHLAGLALYETTPLPYICSVLLLSVGYHAFLRNAGQPRPLSSGSFWGMVAVLAIPIVGLIAGAQKMYVISGGSSADAGGRRRATASTLLLLVPVTVIGAALVLPSLRGGRFPTMSEVVVGGVLAVAAAAGAILLLKKGKRG